MVLVWRITDNSPNSPNFPCQTFPLYGNTLYVIVITWTQLPLMYTQRLRVQQSRHLETLSFLIKLSYNNLVRTHLAMVQLGCNMVNNGSKLMGLLKGIVRQYGSRAIVMISLAVK